MEDFFKIFLISFVFIFGLVLTIFSIFFICANFGPIAGVIAGIFGLSLFIAIIGIAITSGG